MGTFGNEFRKIEGYVTTKVATLSSMAALAVGVVIGFVVKALL